MFIASYFPLLDMWFSNADCVSFSLIAVRRHHVALANISVIVIGRIGRDLQQAWNHGWSNRGLVGYR